MRSSLKRVGGMPDHVGLAYETWAPAGDAGKVPDTERWKWLERISNTPVTGDYKHAYTRWKDGFQAPFDHTFELELKSRLLIGQGNVSATDVGLTVHHIWGVPIIPGSAVKGLLAHYVDAVYGSEESALPPWEQRDEERIPWHGVVWNQSQNRIIRGPGKYYRKLFGAPDAEDDADMRMHGFEAGAARGEVIFHDALYVPLGDLKPYAVDVLTVHQKQYYDSLGKSKYPNDYDNPNPVAFLTVRPKEQFLFALSGPAELVKLAEMLLRDALREWGVGAKTSSGYGRLDKIDMAMFAHSVELERVAKAQLKRNEKVSVQRVEDKSGKGKLKFQTSDGMQAHFAGEEAPNIEIGKTIEVWIANVGQSYTITLRDPNQVKRK